MVGAEADIFDWWGAGGPRRFVRRPLWSLIAARANRAVIAAAGDYDVILIMKGLLVGPAIVEALRKRARLVVCFNPDNPWNRAVTSYSRPAELAMPAYDVYLTWSSFLVSRLYASGCKRVEIFRFAWDDELHPNVSVPHEAEDLPIVFAANHSDHRERWLRRLKDLPITTFGPTWAEVVAKLGPTQIHVERGVPVGRPYAEAVARAKVSLNILDPHNCPGTNMRSFEVPGIGGVTLSTWTDDVAQLFADGAVATFRTEEDLRREVTALLSSPNRRAEIRRRSHLLVATEHTFDQRGQQLCDLFGEYL
jgi:spore maturation protein CgeB